MKKRFVSKSRDYWFNDEVNIDKFETKGVNL